MSSATPPPMVPARLFGLFCVASYLLSLSYGSTFLLSLLIGSRGGNEHDAGSVISVAMLSTLVAVIFSGHLSDLLGAARSIALFGCLLVVASLGFALTPGFGDALLFFGLTLGLGWGVFYTLGPIIVAMMVAPAQRARFFALLSGSMMSGIGSGPLLGRLASALGYPLTAAFLLAAAASLIGVLIFWRLGALLKRHPSHLGAGAAKISWASSARVLSSKALFPILMVGLGGCVFGGLSSFQTSYAASRSLDYSLFFLGFMVAAIGSRLLIAGFVVKRDAYRAACLLSGLMLGSILMFQLLVDDATSYLLAAVVLGVGYGLTYSVINGLAANEAPPGDTSQALLLFSLAYFIGVFGFPLLAGRIIVEQGMPALMLTVLGIALLNWLISVGRLVWRGLKPDRVAQNA
ncbi:MULTISPECIES: MFS transporter [Pseudomonas]|uniref:MFS transporter n=1 Tax=Pseudomonas TaxID=286 RepID=UPI0004AC0962|nr:MULTISPECIES: MFS transporter [Pseudomonas]AIC18971.1 MFS transporter [Pseudomonas chlororaphis]AZD91302.1 putative MFS-type transporter [Pseudomonas chlororaphis subsp. aureofaciens]KAB0530232.1 MFS transporter [Pseudomonas chlororaphis subsp. aureofaciens]TSD31664.1 MFS transporter [Pseudomonas sp. ATCC 13985]WDG50044.1 MFS transporter [Pseudomonas chlororaphis]